MKGWITIRTVRYVNRHQANVSLFHRIDDFVSIILCCIIFVGCAFIVQNYLYIFNVKICPNCVRLLMRFICNFVGSNKPVVGVVRTHTQAK